MGIELDSWYVDIDVGIDIDKENILNYKLDLAMFTTLYPSFATFHPNERY